MRKLAIVAIVTGLPAFAQGVITTIAGTDWLFPADGRPAINAPLNRSLGLDVTVDKSGNFYIADDGNQMIMRVGPDGIINVVAGNGILFSSGDGGLAVNAALADPLSVAVDAAGNIYLGEYAGKIRKVTPDGIIRTIAGSGDSGFSGDGGPALQAQLYAPYGLAVDGAGNVYVADTFNSRIRKITPDGFINTVAGGGASLKDGVPATSYLLDTPTRLRVDAAGNLYFNNISYTDLTQDRILKVDTRGIITTMAGGGFNPADGVPATTAGILPNGVAVDASGNIYFNDFLSSSVRKVDSSGLISTVAGNGKTSFSGDGGPARQAGFSFGPYASVAADSAGNIYVADDAHGRIRRINPAGQVATVAGNGLFHFSGDGGPATSATLDFPTGVTGDKAGSIYFTEPFVSRIRRIAPDGTISVFAGTGTAGNAPDGVQAVSADIGYPEYLAFSPEGLLFFSDAIDCVVRSIDLQGKLGTVMGSSNDCTIIKEPHGFDFDSAGNLAVADTANNRIRALLRAGSQAGTIFTIAGTGAAGYTGDGGPAIGAQINQPTCVRVHGNGIYFCDTENNVVRYVDFTSSVITTVAGNGQKGHSGDGGSATQASLDIPQGLIFDAQGNMYIADTGNSLIRRVDSSGIITTVAGHFGSSVPGDGQPPLNGFIGGPLDLYFKPNGDLVFTDIYSNRVHEILNTPPSFQVNPTSLAFTAPAGAQPIDNGIDVAASIPGILFSVSSSANWLTASITAGQMPANIRVAVDPAAVSPGSYNGTLTIAAPNASPASIVIPISFTVTAAGQPSLSVNPGSVTFPFTAQAPARSRPLSISNTGGGQISFTASPSTTSGGSWLQVSPATATIGAFASAAINITASPAGLAPGTYSGVVTVASVNPLQSIVVPVTMTVTSATHTILLPETGLSFFAVQGGGAPAPQNVDILNTGSGQMPWTVSASTLAGGSWLAVFPQSGQTDAASPIVPQVRVNVNPQGLAAGTYYGTVKVSSSGATNDPQFVSVILTVLPAGSNLGPIVQPAGMIFAGVAGAEAPGSQTVSIQSTSASPVTFTSGRVTADGANWIQSLPLSGTITQTQPARIVVQPSTEGLAPGVYRGSLALSFSDGTTRTVALLLVVVAPGTAAGAQARRLSIADISASCQPKTLAPIFTGISNGSSVPAGYPGQVVVKVVDDCANPMTAGGVSVTFSNGDPPLRLTSLKDGNWAGTWIPRRVLPEIVITADAAIPEQNLKGQVQIKVGSHTGDPLPVINTDGIVNAASFAPLGPVAPGSLVAVFGSRLANSLAPAQALPLPLNLAGGSILIAGQPAPLIFASDGQVNAAVPYGIAVNTTQQAIATRDSSISVPQPLIIAPAAPGVFTLPDGKQGIVVDVDPNAVQTVVDTAHPATVGHALVIYCTGLGEVTPAVQSGAAAPSNPPATVVNPVSVTIGGVPATVAFAGLTPTQVGLYQINVVVPAGITPGTQVPLVIVSAGQSSAPVTITVR
jgi:uncharacterized protein (TIGR03437 family)